MIQRFCYCSVCPNCFLHFFSIHRFHRFSGILLSSWCLKKMTSFYACIFIVSSPCASMLIFRFTFYIYINSCFIYALPPPLGASQCLPIPMSANTMYTSFVSPAFLRSQPPTASLFFHRILCLVPSLTSQVSNPSYSFTHQTFQRLQTQWKRTSSGLSHPPFPANTYLHFSHYNHYWCFQPAASIPFRGCRDFLLLFFSLLCKPYPLMPSLPKEHLFCFSMLPLWDRCLLCVWKSTWHAVGINRQVTVDLTSRLQQGWHKAATGRLP